MGTVYRATQLSLGRTVALKVIAAPLLGDEFVLARFRSEARLAAVLDHPNLVGVYDAGEIDGITFIAMRFVEGPDLGQILDCGPLEPARAVRLLAQVAAGLDAAHAAGLVHRDVKPANILVAADDNAVLTDFGLTRLAAASDGPTAPGHWVGSPEYVAPEQIRGESVGPASDVYSLGCVLFRMLAGRAPFERERLDACLWAHVHVTPPALSQIDSALAPFDDVIARSLAKDPMRRYGSASELARAAAEAAGITGTSSAGSTRAFAASSPRAASRAGSAPTVRGSKPAGAASSAARAYDIDRVRPDDATEPGTFRPDRLTGARISSRVVVGRGDELAQLHEALDQAAEGELTVTWVGGEAGIGKTRLIHELGLGARTRGLRVLIGGCAGLDGGEMPYGPILAALRHVPRDELLAMVDSLGPSARAELARVLPELAGGAPPADSVASTRSPHLRLFELLLRLLHGLCAKATTLLVLEDMHWADPSTRDFVRYFCVHGACEPVAMVATYRSDELDRHHPLRVLLGELTRSRRVAHIELRRLTRAEVTVQLAEILDAEPQAAVAEEIFDRAQGNPFFAEELLAVSRGGPGAELPATLRDALLVRFDGLSEAAREITRAAAVVGRPADHILLRAASETPGGRVAAALREAVGAHVLTPCGDLLCFRHALVREAVYADLLGVERADLHRRVAAALSRPDGPGDPAELARHWRAAGEPGLALSASVEAGLGAARSYAFNAAIAHFECAIDLWEEAGEARVGAGIDLAGLFAHTAEAAWCLGDVRRAAAECRRALDAIDPDTDPVRAAALFERLGRYSTSEPKAAIACYERALELLPPGPSAQRARVLGSQGLALTYLDRWEESSRRCEEALSVARAAAAPADEAHAMSTLGMALTFLGRPLEGEPMLRTALAIAVDLGRPEDVARAHIGLAEVLRYLGRSDAALGIAQEGERAARRAGLEHLFGRYLSLSAADDLFHLGRWDEADERLRAVDPDRLERTSRELWLSVSGRIAVARGDAVGARSHLLAASALCADGRPEAVPHVYGGLAELALWLGRPGEAGRLVADGLRLVGSTEDALNTPVLLAIGVRAHVEAALPRTAAERRRARMAATALTMRLKRILGIGEERFCPPQGRAHMATCAAELTRLRPASAGDHVKSAAATWARAASAWEAIGHPYQVAYARLREAEALSAGADRADLEGALETARERASRLGAGFLLGEVERIAAAAPGPPVPSGALSSAVERV